MTSQNQDHLSQHLEQQQSSNVPVQEQSQSQQNMSQYQQQQQDANSNYNIMDPVNRERAENQLRFQNPNPHNLPEYPFSKLYNGLTDKQKKQLDKKRQQIKMTDQPPNPSDFAQLRQIYAGLSDDKITPALDYINEKGELKRRPDSQFPLPSAMNSQGGLELPNYVIGAKVNHYTTKKILYGQQPKNKQAQIKATKKEYIQPQKQNLKDNQPKDGLKDTKDTKGKQSKDTKDYGVKGMKDSNSQVKYNVYDHSVKDGKHFQMGGVKAIKSQEGAQGGSMIKSQKDRERIQLSSGNKQQEQLVNLFCHYQGDLLLIARALNRKSVSSVCRELNPIITQAIRNLENVIIRRKIRRMAIRWADSQLKRFRHKFYEIKDGKLYGCEKRVRLGPLYKLMKMKYDRSITITNEQANQLYEGCLDLNLAIDEDTKARTNWNTQSVVWTHAQIKFFCRLILKTNDYQAISNELIKQFGGVKEKFAPSKLVVKLDSLLKGSLKKLKHLALEYQDLPTLCRVQGKDFRNICYGTHFEFSKVRKAIIQFFLASNPPKQQIGRILHIVNMFLEESRKFQQNRSKRTKLQMNINDLKKEYTEEELQRLRIQKALAHPQYMRTPRDIYYTERNNVKYEDQDVSIIPKGNAQQLERRLRQIKQMQRQRYLKLQQEKKLLQPNNDRGKMPAMRKPDYGGRQTSMLSEVRNKVKTQNPMQRSAFDSDDQNDNIRSSTSRSNVKIDYESALSRSGPNQQISSAFKNSNTQPKKQFKDDNDFMDMIQPTVKKSLATGKMGNKFGMQQMGGPMARNPQQRQGKPNLDFDSDDSFELGPNAAAGKGGISKSQVAPIAKSYGNFNNFKSGGLNLSMATANNSYPQGPQGDTFSMHTKQLSQLQEELDNMEDAFSVQNGGERAIGYGDNTEGQSNYDQNMSELYEELGDLSGV